MNGTDSDAFDDRAVRAYVTGDGAVKLKEKIKEKLVEFVPDFADETLVDYVIVLLRNGRGKEETKKELNVFLGDETAHFVSWLWDHFSSSLPVHDEPKASCPHDKSKSSVNKRSGGHDSHPEQMSGRGHIDLEYEKEGLTRKAPRNRHNRDWRELVQKEMKPFIFRSTKYENHLKGTTQQRTDRIGVSRSPRPPAGKKRSWQDERQLIKRVTTAHSIGPPCRLLQFALRDAVRTAQETISGTEPAPKRLRSVISASHSNYFFDNNSQMTIPAEDTVATHQLSNDRESLQEERELSDLFQNPGFHDIEYYHSNEYDGELERDITMFDENTEISFASESDNEDHSDIGSLRHQTGTYATEDKRSLVSDCSVFHDADETKQTRLDQDLHAKSRKIVNISVNVNTWKPPNGRDSMNLAELESLPAAVKGDVKGKPNLQLRKTAIFRNDNQVACADMQKEVQKTVSSIAGSCSASPPDDDVNSRILFVNNVHFAATKDTISRHFNKFGEVVKVIVMKDAATGQPNGSVFIEFSRKESAEQALALNGTSFMSRVLKVVRRNVARHEASPLTARPLLPRASPLTFVPPRAAFPRGRFRPSIFSHGLPVKPRARSLQWKRGGPDAQHSECVKAHQLPSLPVRNFTYVRNLSKPDSNSGESNS